MGKKCISIVVPMYNEQESLQILYRELNRVTREMGDYDFEYLFVNDGSKDATLQKIRELAAEDERVHYLSFSRNFGKEAALLFVEWYQIYLEAETLRATNLPRLR